MIMRKLLATVFMTFGTMAMTAQTLPYQNPQLTAAERAGKIQRYQSLSFSTPNINIFRDPSLPQDGWNHSPGISQTT